MTRTIQLGTMVLGVLAVANCGGSSDTTVAATGLGGSSSTASSGAGGAKASSSSSSTGKGGAASASTGTSGSSTGGATSGGGTGSADTSSSATGASSSSGTSGCTPVNGGGVFTAVNAWNTDVSCDPPSPDSAKIVAALVAAGGWGSNHGGNKKFQMDMSIEVLQADGTTAPFQEAPDYYSPDCEDPATVPLPKVGAIEGQMGPMGYTCDTDNDDCHLLVVDAPNSALFELYNTNVSGGTVSALCAIKWNLAKTYPINLRGDGCTSADAGGFPITAMLANADEVKAGAVKHALRLILGNDRIRKNMYVNPGTHTTSATAGGGDTPPYGVRFRLRADYPMASLPSDGARVLAKALQQFGMFLADGGTIPLTVQSDQFTTAKWADVGVDAESLTALTPNDFEVVDMGPLIDGTTVSCNPMP